MGSVSSVITVVSVVLIAGGIFYGFIEKRPPPPEWAARQFVTDAPAGASSSEKKKGKKKKVAQAADKPAGTPAPTAAATEPTPNVVSMPAVVSVPGGFDSAAESNVGATTATTKPKAKKKKAKKAAAAGGGTTGIVGGGNRSIPVDAQSESSATAPESSTPVPRPTKRRSPSALDADGPWTRVESRKRSTNAQESAQISREPSDLGITTSVTEASSPVTERTEDEQSLENVENRRTLAERLLPKPRKTGVEDMLETPDAPSLARVMRVQPRPDERPAAGFSWGDYEDVEEARATADDADGEDEGWITAKSARPRTRPAKAASSSQSTQSAPETLTKKQRQNLAKREVQKAAKAQEESERLAKLASHKRELEKSRIVEQYKNTKKTGGGMSASMNEKGQLVWD